MIVSFPCRPAGGDRYEGNPLRAEPCHCDCGAWLAESGDTCLRCGHYTRFTINETWLRRAMMLARLDGGRSGRQITDQPERALEIAA